MARMEKFSSGVNLLFGGYMYDLIERKENLEYCDQFLTGIMREIAVLEFNPLFTNLSNLLSYTSELHDHLDEVSTKTPEEKAELLEELTSIHEKNAVKARQNELYGKLSEGIMEGNEEAYVSDDDVRVAMACLDKIIENYQQSREQLITCLTAELSASPIGREEEAVGMSSMHK